MDKNNVLLLVLLLVSEIMGAVPEKYLWVNGYLDTVCKVLKEIVKSSTKDGDQVATPPLEPLATDAPLEEPA
jgi:hypothetical protein